MDQKITFFSVIMPLYNKAPYVERALKSVFAQSCTDWELIVVNDGSTDDSGVLADKFLQNKSNSKLINQSNAGVSTARNNGVAQAQGTYLCFLDADDWWAPTYLEEMRDLIEQYPQAGIYASAYYIVKNKTQRLARIGVDAEFGAGIINYFKVYAKTLEMPVWTGATIIKKNIFIEQKGFKPNLKLGEDFDLWVRIAIDYPVAFVNKALAYYNQDVDVSNRAVNSRLYQCHEHMLFALDYLEPIEKTNPNYKQLIDKLRVRGLLPYYLNKQYRKAAQRELHKVDWCNQPKSTVCLYKMPVFCLKCYQYSRIQGSIIKQFLIKTLKNVT